MLETMEKKIRKSIKKEIQKIVRNISGESSQQREESSKPGVKLEEDILLTRNLTNQAEICENISKNESYLKNENNETSESEVWPNFGDESMVHDPLEDLSMDFHSILKKEYFYDVTIKCGTDVFKSHKIVLCARSPVFEAMFTNPMQESEDGVVIIEDMEPHVLCDLLDFVYSGQLKDLTVPKACDLMYAAEKYQIRTLKQLCVNHLRTNLAVDNAFQILECANLYDNLLRSHTLKYISDTFSVIEKTEDWRTIQSKSPALALEVYSTVVKALQRKNEF